MKNVNKKLARFFEVLFDIVLSSALAMVSGVAALICFWELVTIGVTNWAIWGFVFAIFGTVLNVWYTNFCAKLNVGD